MRDFAADFPAPATQVARVLVVLFLAGCAERSTESATRDSELVQTISVGGPDGASEGTFGRVEDVRAAEGGGFFVFDRHSPSITWFSSDGHYLGGVREAGEGPGELSRPIAIAPTRDDGLAVLDPGSGRISFYRASPDGLAFQNQSFTTWPMTFSTGQGFCAVGDRFFAAGARGEQLLHEIGPEGETLQSFGTAEEV